MTQEGLRRHVLRVLRMWRSWSIFSDDFLNGLQVTLLLLLLISFFVDFFLPFPSASAGATTTCAHMLTCCCSGVWSACWLSTFCPKRSVSLWTLALSVLSTCGIIAHHLHRVSEGAITQHHMYMMAVDIALAGARHWPQAAVMPWCLFVHYCLTYT